MHKYFLFLVQKHEHGGPFNSRCGPRGGKMYFFVRSCNPFVRKAAPFLGKLTILCRRWPFWTKSCARVSTTLCVGAQTTQLSTSTPEVAMAVTQRCVVATGMVGGRARQCVCVCTHKHATCLHTCACACTHACIHAQALGPTMVARLDGRVCLNPSPLEGDIHTQRKPVIVLGEGGRF
jgi:hypothetical protein